MGSIPGRCWVQVIPKTFKMVMVPACMELSMKEEPRYITGRPGVSIMRLGGLAYLAWAAMTCKTTCEKHDLEAVWKELNDELTGC